MLVKDELEEIPGVSKVEADHTAGVVKFEAEDKVDLNKIKYKINGLGYEVVEGDRKNQKK